MQKSYACAQHTQSQCLYIVICTISYDVPNVVNVESSAESTFSSSTHPYGMPSLFGHAPRRTDRVKHFCVCVCVCGCVCVCDIPYSMLCAYSLSLVGILCRVAKHRIVGMKCEMCSGTTTATQYHTHYGCHSMSNIYMQ